MQEESTNKVLKDEEFISNIKLFLIGVKKHGLPAVLKAINCLDFKKADGESDFNKIVDVVCNHVEVITGRSKSLLKKELSGFKRNEYTTARNLVVLFASKYCDVTQIVICKHLSRTRRDFVHVIKSSFKILMEQDNISKVKIIGSVTRKEFIDLYNKIDIELQSHFKNTI